MEMTRKRRGTYNPLTFEQKIEIERLRKEASLSIREVAKKVKAPYTTVNTFIKENGL